MDNTIGLPSLQILNRFGVELVKDRSFVMIQDPAIITIFKLVEGTEKYWFIEDDTFLWKKQAWEQELKFKQIRKKQLEEEKKHLFVIQDSLELLRAGIVRVLGMKNDVKCFELALSLLNDRNELACNIFGVKGVANIPLLDKPHQFQFESGGEYYILK